TFFKVLGALALIFPFVNRKIKEWAYAGFTFNFIAAAVSHWAVDGFDGQTVFPMVALVILGISYFQYHKLQASTSMPSMSVAMTILLLIVAPFTANSQDNPTPVVTGYAPVNGLNMYYEIHGDANGVPLVLVHGSFMNIP